MSEGEDGDIQRLESNEAEGGGQDRAGGWGSDTPVRWEVRRTLYIGDYLYTISRSLVEVNRLTDFSEVAAVEIP